MRSRLVMTGVLAVVCSGLLGLTAAQSAAPVQVDDAGVGKAPKGSGIRTTAALENPKCNPDTVQGWGTFSLVTENGGPFCVAPAPADNGGATYRGVTKNTVRAVVVLANEAQIALSKQRGGPPPKNQATGGEGTIKDAFLDSWAAVSHVYEDWGRKVEFTFVTSSGDDEAAQRSDAVAVEQAKPMFVIDTTSNGLGTLASVLGNDKYVVYSFATTTKESLAQAPYRWGQNDPNAGAINAAEFVGKQLAGRKAQYAGDEAMHSKPRKFGVVIPNLIDINAFVTSLKKYGVTLATPPLEYTTNGSPIGDPTTAQAEAPTVISKLKAAGVTSVIMFTDSAMTGEMTRVATRQQYAPEWVITGYQYQDISLLARPSYDQQQWAHAFGISTLWPYVKGANVNTSLIQWYWGQSQGTVDIVTQTRATWLAAAIHYAGPNLTPKNVELGFFALPASGGAASGSPVGSIAGYGRTAGMPYPSYFNMGKDFAPIWYDAKTSGESQIYPTAAPGVTWYVGNGKRYAAGSWPKKPFKFFDETGSLYVFDASPVPTSPVVPCTGCPSAGGPGTPSGT